MAIGCTRFPRRASFASVVAAVTVVAVSVSATTVELRQGPKDDVRSAVDALAARHHPGQPVVAAARWDALGLDHYARHRHRRLLPDLVLPPAPPPTSGATVWVLRRASGGVKGDASKLVALDHDLARRGLSVQDELRFDGRYADVIVQRWEPEQMGGA